MLSLNLGLVPAMQDVNLEPELSVEELRHLLDNWMVANLADIEFVREVAHTMHGWENPDTQRNLSDGWTASPNEEVLNLVGVVPVIVSDDATLDLVICRFKSANKPWRLRFLWDSNQGSDAPRSRENLQQVVDAFAKLDTQLLDS